MSSWGTRTGGEIREGKAREMGSQQRNHRRENPPGDKRRGHDQFLPTKREKSILLYSDLCTTVAQMAGTLEDELMTYWAKDLDVLRVCVCVWNQPVRSQLYDCWVKLTISTSALVSFNAILVNPFILGLDGSLSDSTITSGEGTLLSCFASLKKEKMHEQGYFLRKRMNNS